MKYPKLNREIRNFVEYQIKTWPQNKKILEELEAEIMPRITPNYIQQSNAKTGVYRPTETAAIKLCTWQYLRQLDFTVDAIQSVYDRLSPEDQELIRLHYWSGNLTPEGIIMKLHMERTTFYKRLSLILLEIARRLGYINLNEGG